MFRTNTSQLFNRQCGRALLDLFARNNSPSAIGAILVAPIIAFWISPKVSNSYLFIWLSCIWILGTVDLVISLLYLKQLDNDIRLRFWRHLFIINSAILGVCWSSIFLILETPYSEHAVTLLVFMIFGISAFNTTTRSTLISSSLAFDLCAIIPMSLWLYIQNDQFYLSMGTVSLLYLCLLLISLISHVNEQQNMLLQLGKHKLDYLTLAENHPDNIARWSAEGKLLYANPMFLNVFGLASSRFTGKSFSDITNNVDYGSPGHKAFLKVLVTGETHSVRYPILKTSGEEMIYDIKLVPEFDTDGRLTTVLSIGHEVTNYILSQQQLAEAKKFSEQLIDGISDPLFVKDKSHNWIMMNKAFAKMIGKTREALLGKSDYDFLAKEQADVFWQNDTKVFETGEIDLNEETLTDVHGNIHYLQTKKSTFMVGGKHFLVGVIRDITERRLMELSLSHREQEFRTLIENTPDTIARYDLKCRRIYSNPALIKLSGFNEIQLACKTLSEWPGGEQGKIFENKIQQVISTGKSVEFELSCPPGAERLYSLISLTPEFGLDGKIKTILAIGRDITELQASKEKIHYMAFYDSLTGLPNRMLYSNRLDHTVADAKRYNHSVGVMMVDLDHFKEVNDTLGHAAGDKVLQGIAMRISTCLRACDTAARLSGDEFALILPDVRSSEDLGQVAKKILGLISTPFFLDGTELFISGSIGISLFPSDGNNASELLKYADTAMYHVKRSGRASFHFYSSKLTASSRNRLSLEADLRHAIERDQLVLHYQPKINLFNGQLLGSEALLRWIHPRQGVIPPDKFISIAEDTGLIHEIGEWVLCQACCCAAEWNQYTNKPHEVAINLSAKQFQSTELLERIEIILSDTGCRPNWIELEITESLLLEENDDLLSVLKHFSEMGIKIAIDDFGTGYSALSYLARFPIHTLKIDRSFTSQVVESNYHAEVVKAMLSIAQSLGQSVVAEGVETADQEKFLKLHGCHIGQGFLYGKPMPRQQFELQLGDKISIE